MPVALRAYGLRFVIYLNDHEPPHVHAIGDGEYKIALSEDATIIGAFGGTLATARKAQFAVRENLAMLLEKWDEIHG